MSVQIKNWKRTKFDAVTIYEIPMTAPKIHDIFLIYGKEVGTSWGQGVLKSNSYWMIELPDFKSIEVFTILRKLRESGTVLDESEEKAPANGVESSDLGGTLDDNAEADEDMPPEPINPT